MTITAILLLLGGGLLCGIINVVGGGGSLLALPILLALGLPASVANGTNRVAILCQDLVSLGSFSRHKAVPWKIGFHLSIPIIIGSLLGAWAATRWMSETVMNILLLLLIFGTALLLFLRKNGFDSTKSATSPPQVSFYNLLLFFGAGFYGGFIQAGFTYLIMVLMLFRMGSTMITADAVKIFLNLLILPLALLIFIASAEVVWSYGLIMGIGSAVGGYLGTRFVMRWSAAFIRRILLILLALSAFYVLFFRMLHL